MSDSFIQLGQVQVATTDNKGHAPEFWAEQVTNKICGISQHAPDHVRQQALAFKKVVHDTVLRGIQSGIASDRTTVISLLRAQGHTDMADIIKEI
jgi:hypothetical protein|tara:strand:+ start:1294 stop:1578 length:285 start_codon:yes stop_codon:yes gene_type:complete